MITVLQVGDTVLWSGGWGAEAPKAAKVKGIELCEKPREKYGIDVREAWWKDKDRLVVTLDNGHWAYGNQLQPIG